MNREDMPVIDYQGEVYHYDITIRNIDTPDFEALFKHVIEKNDMILLDEENIILHVEHSIGSLLICWFMDERYHKHIIDPIKPLWVSE